MSDLSKRPDYVGGPRAFTKGSAHPVAVDLNSYTVTTVASIAGSTSIDGVENPNVFAPGDTVQILNPDGSNNIVVIQAIGQNSLRLAIPLAFNIADGASLFKLPAILSTTLPPVANPASILATLLTKTGTEFGFDTGPVPQGTVAIGVWPRVRIGSANVSLSEFALIGEDSNNDYADYGGDILSTNTFGPQAALTGWTVIKVDGFIDTEYHLEWNSINHQGITGGWDGVQITAYAIPAILNPVSTVPVVYPWVTPNNFIPLSINFPVGITNLIPASLLGLIATQQVWLHDFEISFDVAPAAGSISLQDTNNNPYWYNASTTLPQPFPFRGLAIPPIFGMQINNTSGGAIQARGILTYSILYQNAV